MAVTSPTYTGPMRTIVLGERPAELEHLFQRRRAMGADLHDEVWEGEYHMAPAPRRSHGRVDDEIAAILRPLAKRARLFPTGPFNLGDVTDYRVPDRGLHRDGSDATWLETAALVVEIVSPDDETWAKLPFYAIHAVDEIMIADPRDRTLSWLRLDAGQYQRVAHSTLLDVDVAHLAAQIDWPPTADD